MPSIFKVEDVVEKIKILQCPTGEIGNRIAEILEDCGIASRSEIEVERYKGLDINGAEGFCAKIPGDKKQCIIVFANTGMKDYVAKVVEVI